MDPANRDKLFSRFVASLFFLMCLVAIATMIAVFISSEGIATKLLNVFAGMFSGVLGLGSGYLLGRGNGNSKPGGGAHD